MASRKDSWEFLASSDDETVSLTSTVISEKKLIYPLEAVLCERRKKKEGITSYLVKWEGYPDIECTWELEEHFQDAQTLVDWKDQKMKISRGLVEPFDVDGWKRKVKQAKAATAKRRARRRKKKIELGLPVADPAVEEEEPSSTDPSDDDYDYYDGNPAESSDSDIPLFSPISVWTAKEESALLEGLNRLKALDWEKLLRMYGPSGIINEDLKEKTENDMRRKAVSLRKDFEASGREFPVPQSLDKTHGKDQQSRGNDKPVRSQGDQQQQAPPQIGSVRRTKYVGTVHPSEPQGSPRAPSNAIDRPERPKVKIPPTRTLNSTDTGSASATPMGMARAKSKANPTSASSQLDGHPSLPSATAARRPSQLGTVGRGPASRGAPIPKVPKEQPVNIMKNWGADPLKRRRSRYEWRTAQEAEGKPGTTFKKFSTRRRFELAGRYEHAPDASSLTFVNRKDGKVLPEGPASIVPRPATKTPFQLLQEQLGEGEPGSTGAPASTARPSLQRAATLGTSMNGSKLLASDKQQIDTVNNADPAIEVNSLPQMTRRASVPFQSITQPVQRDKPMFAAPVAVMDSNVNDNDATSFEQCMSPQPEVSLSPRLNKTVKITENAPKRASGGQGKPHPNLETPTSHAPSLSGPLSHDGPYIHPDRKHAPTPHEPSQPVLPQPMATNLQAGGPGCELFPLDVPRATQKLDTYCKPTDVIAEILTGSEGDSTGAVIFRGLRDHDLKYLFITIRVPPRQMHVWCKAMVTAGEFAMIFHDPPSYLGSGWIVPFHQTAANVDKVSGILAEHASGGLFFAERFMILLYPASCVGWEYLDAGLGDVAPEARLRFAMLDPWPRMRQMLNESRPYQGKRDAQARLQAPPMNAVLRTRFGMDFQRLITSPKNKDGSKARPVTTFFLIFPPAAQEEFDIAVDWIRANGPATIYRHTDQGAWAHFCEMVDQGVIICHATFIDYWAIPNLAHTLKRTINMFSFSLEPMSCHAPDPHLIRLFPAGTAILLTDSLFLLRPVETARILAWFRLYILPTKPHGTWKICTRPAIREWLLKIQASLRYYNGRDFVTCYGEVMRLLPSGMTKNVNHDIPKDNAHIACMVPGMSNFHEALGTNIKHLVEMDNGAITQNDHALCSWFAGWAMMKQEKFRRFHIVTGRDEESDEHRQLKERMKKYSHVEVGSFERFAKKYGVWDLPKLKRKDDERRAEAGRTKKAAAAKFPEWMRRGSATTAGSEDVEMDDAQQAEQQSLFLPMDISPS
ncbi:MAG: hypothetical protein LQ343_006234 [Gyalolechia ehrenbergii]|nr:MAG: hypothetical protein LQ343_006234 [Gyalolechia ehrenbergii]